MTQNKNMSIRIDDKFQTIYDNNSTYDEELKKFKVEFSINNEKYNDGIITAVTPSTQTVTSNKQATRPNLTSGTYLPTDSQIPSVLKNNYNIRLVNWYLDSECTQIYDFNTFVISDIKLYAKWELSSDTGEYVIYNNNGIEETIFKLPCIATSANFFICGGGGASGTADKETNVQSGEICEISISFPGLPGGNNSGNITIVKDMLGSYKIGSGGQARSNIISSSEPSSNYTGNSGNSSNISYNGLNISANGGAGGNGSNDKRFNLRDTDPENKITNGENIPNYINYAGINNGSFTNYGTRNTKIVNNYSSLTNSPNTIYFYYCGQDMTKTSSATISSYIGVYLYANTQDTYGNVKEFILNLNKIVSDNLSIGYTTGTGSNDNERYYYTSHTMWTTENIPTSKVYFNPQMDSDNTSPNFYGYGTGGYGAFTINYQKLYCQHGGISGIAGCVKIQLKK